MHLKENKFQITRAPPFPKIDRYVCFIVKDANGLAVSYTYFEDEPGPVPTAQISKSPVDAKTAADLLYNRYVAVIRDYGDKAEPKVREPISVLLEKKQ
jgi:hypothetical protein